MASALKAPVPRAQRHRRRRASRRRLTVAGRDHVLAVGDQLVFGQTFDREKYPDGTARLRIPAGKTMRERMVPLHDEAAFRLRALIAQRLQARDRPILDERTGDYVRFVFYRRGGRISPDYLLQDALKIVCTLAGLVDSNGKPTITAHRFRHTVGTQLAERGAKLHTIMSVLGHQTPHMSMVYARISDAEVLRDYRSVLGREKRLPDQAWRPYGRVSYHALRSTG